MLNRKKIVDFSRKLVRAYFRIFHFIEINGIENIPEGSIIIASNHQSFYDPALLSIPISQPLNFMARDTLFKIPFFGSIIRFYGAMPVKRDATFISKEVIKKTLQILNNNESIFMFPEGTRTHDGKLGKIRPGPARIALMTGATIVPVTIKGAFESWHRTHALPRPFHKIIVTYHPPIFVEKCGDKNIVDEKADEICRKLHDAISSSL